MVHTFDLSFPFPPVLSEGRRNSDCGGGFELKRFLFFVALGMSGMCLEGVGKVYFLFVEVVMPLSQCRCVVAS
jgi:hypothetical protein